MRSQLNAAQSPAATLVRVENDLVRCTDAAEFPLSSMSRKIVDVLDRHSNCSRKGFALDVGTGSGVHAIILNQMGYNCVLGVDSNSMAVSLALRRAIRLGLSAAPISRGRIAGESVNWGNAKIWFCASPLQELNKFLSRSADLIIFNPPSFFSKSSIDDSSPVSTGVYSGRIEGALNVEGSLLHQFFDSVVLPLLAIGGELICSWPGLERRSVEIDPKPDRAGIPVHPASLLAHWFGLKVTADHEDPADFYKYTASISDYGLGGAFWLNFRQAIDTRCYSSFLSLDDSRRELDAEFRFGVLHLTRTGIRSFTTNPVGESDE